MNNVHPIMADILASWMESFGAPVCRNCGRPGTHYYAATLTDPAGYTCCASAYDEDADFESQQHTRPESP